MEQVSFGPNIDDDGLKSKVSILDFDRRCESGLILLILQVTDLLGCLPDYTNDSGASQYLYENSGR